jgi:predicted esterase
MRALNIETTTHGRVLIEDAAVSPSGRVLVGFHGYGQNADIMLDELRRIPGAEAWRLVSVQALHPFYTRGDREVVASWMTRQDREAAIADNLAYVDRAVAAAVGDDGRTLAFLGFSQGASMAARAAARSRRRASGLILLGGDIPPDVKDDPHVAVPPTLVGVGGADAWYRARVESDLEYLARRGIAHRVVRFAGGHEFTDEFRAAAGEWLVSVSSSPTTSTS